MSGRQDRVRDAIIPRGGAPFDAAFLGGMTDQDLRDMCTEAHPDHTAGYRDCWVTRELGRRQEERAKARADHR